MSNKYGPHGEDVEAFLAEVEATTDPAVWDQILTGIDREGLAAAAKARTKIKLSASASSAVYSGALRAYRSLHLTNEDLPRSLFGRIDASSAIDDAAGVIARGDRLAPEHRWVCLSPFATAGFASVLASHAWTSLDANTDTGQQASETSSPDAD
jgi:hypothetical protein